MWVMHGIYKRRALATCDFFSETLPNRIYAHCSSSKLSWKWRITSVMLFLLRTNRHLHDFLEQHSFISSCPTCVSSGIFSQNVVSWWICIYSILERLTPKSKISSWNMFTYIDIIQWKLILSSLTQYKIIKFKKHNLTQSIQNPQNSTKGSKF